MSQMTKCAQRSIQKVAILFLLASLVCFGGCSWFQQKPVVEKIGPSDPIEFEEKEKILNSTDHPGYYLISKDYLHQIWWQCSLIADQLAECHSRP